MGWLVTSKSSCEIRYAIRGAVLPIHLEIPQKITRVRRLFEIIAQWPQIYISWFGGCLAIAVCEVCCALILSVAGQAL